jgi:DNA polymerase-3 subunit delta
VFYIFHGENELGRAEELARFRAKLAKDDGGMADLNTAVLDGGRVTVGELRHACDTVPFMAKRRLVIVEGLLQRLAPRRPTKGQEDAEGEEPAWKQAFVQDLEDYLPSLPETARLIFVESKALPASHPILKVAKAEGETGKAFVKFYAVPKDDELPSWIRRRTTDKGGSIGHDAVALLAALVGHDLRTLDQEIEKLLIYTDGEPINADDVRLLVSRAREMSIFDLVDAVGLCRTDRALKLLHHMLDDLAEPLYLLAMLARQIRILIQVSELQDQYLGQKEIATRLKLHPFVVKKGLQQARNFDRSQLEAAHRRLVETDWSIKTGKMDVVLALDLLVVELSRASGTPIG